MRRAFLTGAAMAVQRWPVVLMLFAASIASALIFGAAAWTWLSVALDRSLATRTLLTDLDAQVFLDLLAHHREGLVLLPLTGLVLAGCCWSLGVWLNAVAVAAVGREVPWRECPLEGCRAYPTYLCMCVVINLLQAGILAALCFAGHVLTRWTTDSASDMLFYWLGGAVALLGALAVFFLTTVHDHARVRAARTGAGAAKALGWGFRYVGRGTGPALPLALLLLGTSLLAWCLYQSVGSFVRTDTALGVGISLAWGEALLLSRAFLRVWWFASTAQLQSAAEHSAAWSEPSGEPLG